MDSKAVNEWLLRYYDKVITGVVLSVLLISVIYLGIHLGVMKAQRTKIKHDIEKLPILNPSLAAVDVVPYEQALARMSQPAHVDATNWTHSLFVPVERIFCPACSKPSLTTSDVCSLCGAELPKGKPESQDKDSDELPDAWELKYGLDPASASDATKDGDADGYDNLTEFAGDSDPSNPKSVPALDHFLTLNDLIPNKFNLRFTGKTVLPGGSVQYQLNVIDKTKKTHLKKMGESVDGFKLVGYQELFKTNGMRRVDVSVLKLQRGDRAISLTKNMAEDHRDYTAVIGFALDPTWIRKGLRGNVFDVVWKGRTVKYKIKEIDSRNRIVVLGPLPDGQDVEIKSAEGPEPVVEKDSTPVPGGTKD